jgi:hypothetical protein|tara:strand:+ start:320 stop:940 length:621 start_codon:yes stop_codon:yes gene_type:complete
MIIGILMLSKPIQKGKQCWSDQNYYIVKALSEIYLKNNPNPEFTQEDFKMKCEIFEIPDNKTCFVSGVLSNAFSDHIYETIDYFKYTEERGINDNWNLVPVCGEYNKTYKNFKFTLEDGEKVKKNIGYENLTDDELLHLMSSTNNNHIQMAEIYVKIFTWKLYAEKKGAKLSFKETPEMTIIRERFIDNYNKIWEQFEVDCMLITK